MRYIALIHGDNEPGFGVSLPDFPGCVSDGDTEEEAIRRGREALTFHIEEHGGRRGRGFLPRARAPRSRRVPIWAEWLKGARMVEIEIESADRPPARRHAGGRPPRAWRGRDLRPPLGARRRIRGRTRLAGGRLGRREGGPPPTVVIPPRRRRHERHHAMSATTFNPLGSRPRPRSGRSRAQTGRSARRSVAPSRHRRPWRVRDQRNRAQGRPAHPHASRRGTARARGGPGSSPGTSLPPSPIGGWPSHFRWTVHDGRLVHERGPRADSTPRPAPRRHLRASHREPAERLSPEDTVRTCQGAGRRRTLVPHPQSRKRIGAFRALREEAEAACFVSRVAGGCGAMRTRAPDWPA